MSRTILYKCNGEKSDCPKRNCYRSGGTCRHTTNVEYAENFHISKAGCFKEGEEDDHIEDTNAAAEKITSLP